MNFVSLNPCECEPVDCPTDLPVGGIGSDGMPGNIGATGADGISRYSFVTHSFAIPVITLTVDINVVSSAWITIDQPVYIEGAGYFIATATPDVTTVTIRNDGALGNGVAGLVISYGGKISAGGAHGVNITVPNKGYALVTEQFASGTSVAATGLQLFRTPNTIVYDTTGMVSLYTIQGGQSHPGSISGSYFILPIGKYRIIVQSYGLKLGGHKAYLYNTTLTAGAFIIQETFAGTNEYSGHASNYGSAYSKITAIASCAETGRFFISIKNSGNTTPTTDGLGRPCTFADDEIYCLIEIFEL